MGLYNWRNKLLLDLPMRMADHDPVNTLSVNRGRAGTALDAVFGAGAATPTKLGYRRGYSFNGGDWMDCSAGYALTTPRVTMMLAFSSPDPGATDFIFDWETVGGDVVGIISTTAASLRFYSGSVAAVNNAAIATIANYGLAASQLSTVVGTYDGTNTSIFVNGQFVAVAVTPVAPALTANPMRIGARTSTSNYYGGNIYHVGMADFVLSPHMVKQYYREMMKRLHQV